MAEIVPQAPWSIDENLNRLEVKIKAFNNPKAFFDYSKNENGDYFAVVNHQTLNVTFKNQEQLVATLKIIAESLQSSNDLELTWDLHGRYIVEKLPFYQKILNVLQWEYPNHTLTQTWEYSEYNNNPSEFQQAKNNTEELFKFIMTLKWIPQDKWTIGGKICKTENTYQCISDLWNKKEEN